MLESVLADVLTRVLGQYLEGIDRDSVRFGAWSGLVELRGVALRPEALAVLFETLGMDLPVTVEAGFIGLLRLQVPWKAIGTTPVQIHMEDITIIARPVRGDGSDDSELQTRERRIKRAKLITDDAVREASWGVTPDSDSASSWSTWLVSDQLRAKIVDNIQIHLKDIILRFEDPFSDPRRPYIASLVCKSLKAVSVNRDWQEAFVERGEDGITRKLLEVKGFRIDWAPITPRDAPGLSRATSLDSSSAARRFETPELLKQFVTHDVSPGSASLGFVRSLLRSVDGSLRLRLAATEVAPGASVDFRDLEPSVDLDIRFPDVSVELDDVQYACILQTSVYFARLATRGFRPQTPKERWKWAVDQLLPGFTNRRERALRFTESGLAETRDRRLVYVAYRKSLLKARRTGGEEPKQIAEQLESMEDSLSFEEVLAYRDVVDRRIEIEGADWRLPEHQPSSQSSIEVQGTSTSSFWRMLGYSDEQSTSSSIGEGPTSGAPRPNKSSPTVDAAGPLPSSGPLKTSLTLRVAFLLNGASVKLSERGFPAASVPRVALNLRHLRVGLLYSSAKDLIVEAVLGSIDAWDIYNNTRMVYSRLPSKCDYGNMGSVVESETSYPQDVSDAIEDIRRGSNPAKDLLLEDETYSDDDDSDRSLDEESQDTLGETLRMHMSTDSQESSASLRSKDRSRKASNRRDSTPPPTYRVTEAEFLGNPSDMSDSQKYIAAFRYAQMMAAEGTEFSQSPRTSLDVSVATLEAVVDGPKGSFVWGLKFWRPKGMVQDPIMAFLGATAGARIAELRMEVEEALLANKVPMQINAVIRAPRFLFPSTEHVAPAVVVNMGTLGICTSDNSLNLSSPSPAPEKKAVRYSNYVLTLDDLGMYFSPNLSTAASRNLFATDDERASDKRSLDSFDRTILDTANVERIIRPFSLRFVLQTLRDAKVVQVAHAPRAKNPSPDAEIAKVRIRGNIPGLSLILTQRAFQHMLVAAQKWGEQLGPSAARTGTWQDGSSQSGVPWNRIAEEKIDVTGDRCEAETAFLSPSAQNASAAVVSDEQPSSLASYDVKVLLQKVAVEIRETADTRLVTAVASQMRANIVKTGKTNLLADFSLRSWSVTDGSRGSTAAFRRLVYAGTFVGPKGVSPPRSLSGKNDGGYPSVDAEGDKNFVNIRYTLDFASSQQMLLFRFLSLNMVCVRETYARLVLFFHRVREHVRSHRRHHVAGMGKQAASRHQDVTNIRDSPGEIHSHSSPNARVSSASRSRISVVSEFDGFNFQLIASGGVIAFVEMKDSRIELLRDVQSATRIWGSFRYFSIRDLTAPIREHVPVLTYEKPSVAVERMIAKADNAHSGASALRDEWCITMPNKERERLKIRATFRGIKILFLTRFTEVLRQYVSVLLRRVRPLLGVAADDVREAGKDWLSRSEAVSSPSVAQALLPMRIQVDLELADLGVRIPRHSSCSTEALNIRIDQICMRNNIESDKNLVWETRFSGVQLAAEYVLADDHDSQTMSVSSTFLTDFAASLELRPGAGSVPYQEDQPPRAGKAASLRIPRPLRMRLCEAQYTVLYFVLTENFSESVSGVELLDTFDLFDEAKSKPAVQRDAADSESIKASESQTDVAGGDSSIGLSPSAAEVPKPRFVSFDVIVPFFSIEISRGWDVTQDSCQVLGLYLDNVKVDLKIFFPYRLLVELEGKLAGVSDLRAEGKGDKHRIVVPLSKRLSEDRSGSHDSEVENVTLTYDKEGSERPSIVLFLSRLQVELALSLFRDLTYLAIPGWPFLRSSAFAPDIAYLGRIMNVVLSESQVLLFPSEFEDDQRALAFTGEFLLKIDWMKDTGAKRMSLRSTQTEVSTIAHVPSLWSKSERFGFTTLVATTLDRAETPLAYPTDSFLEYVGPDVDEAGRRLELSADAVLCVVSATEVPLLRSVMKCVSRVKPTYLTQRQWVQPVPLNITTAEETPERSRKEEQMRKARESMNITMTVPAARYLFTDNMDGRFVPILETRVTNFSMQAHGGSMVQVEGEMSMDLFNSEKGWWEPAVEPWHLAASMSHGQSGSQAFVVKSEKRLNLNITPTTVTASLAVAKAIRTASRKRKIEEHPKSHMSKVHKVGDPQALRRPSVAAFLVRNELGIPISMSLPSSSRRTTITDSTEVEVGAESESLLTSTQATKGRSRERAMRCSITVSSYAQQELSASEIGKHYVRFHPAEDASTSQNDLRTTLAPPGDPLCALWDVRMSAGAPICTLRSLIRVVNATKAALDVVLVSAVNSPTELGIEAADRGRALGPGDSLAIPIDEIGKHVFVRPSLSSKATSSHPFEWSSPLPDIQWLQKTAQDISKQRSIQDNSVPSASSMRFRRSKQSIVCKARRSDCCDFCLTVVPETSPTSKLGSTEKQIWVDVVIAAPIVLKNKLPRALSYRVFQRDTFATLQAVPGSNREGAILAAGLIEPLQDVHLHCSREASDSTFLSLAYDNAVDISASSEMRTRLPPSEFGPGLNFGDLDSRRIKYAHLSPENADDPQRQRRDFRAYILPQSTNPSRYVISAGVWVRNRSDTTLEVCNRGSFYGAGSSLITLRGRPPMETPDEYICCEGPYLSLRLPRGTVSHGMDDMNDHSNWWTTPSVLGEIEKPVSVSLPGKSLELEVRPSVGLNSKTIIVTIRNTSWIMNSTNSVLQWCQESALDAHGNCRMRMVNALQPRQAQGIHWDGKTSQRALHMRLSDRNGLSDWIWSPAVPLNIGFSRELPAKMYRPKTHEQYIARVASKEIAGDSRALVVYEEDRLNPPYRIVNLCRERAIAFSQTGSTERPWLVRAGKSTRYSWDDPLARRSQRLLLIRILEKEDLVGGKPSGSRENSAGQSGSAARHPSCELNIDVVGDRVMVLSDSYHPPVIVSVSVDGATKIVTFCEEDESKQRTASASNAGKNASLMDHETSAPVPVVGWDDIPSKADDNQPQRAGPANSSDYPLRVGSNGNGEKSIGTRSDTDAAVFLESIGVSVVDADPCELVYIRASGLLFNYESLAGSQSLALHVQQFQVDNQLLKTPYPVLLWMSMPPVDMQIPQGAPADSQDATAIAVEIHRDKAADDIVMIKSFQAAIRPFNLSIEDGLVTRILGFLSDTALVGTTMRVEGLTGEDEEFRLFRSLLPNSPDRTGGTSETATTKRRAGVSSSSRRIYVHDFTVSGTALRLTSIGSGGALAKAAGLYSARTLVGMLLNVENCDFDLSALHVKNVFDSLHHFMLLVREYYVTQLSNQKMKLLASNSLVGNPAALFDAVGTGARDFFNEPGRAKGGAEFFANVGRGSKSLLTHTVGGIVESVSGIPRAMSSGIEKAVGDNDYLAERQRIRGSNVASGHRGSSAKNPAQGLATGALSFAHGISSGVHGLIREPVQGAKRGGAGGLLKGIGRAFIGGVAKPVAGAMDLVAEPVAGFSRQIGGAGKSQYDGNLVVPDRPPRAFRGKNQRLQAFDWRYSVGACLFKAVQTVSGVAYPSALLEWVELSNRPDRTAADAELWVWSVVQRYSRSMPGAKKQIRVEEKQSSRARSADEFPDTRPEKTRVALLTETDLVIATLDCKLVTSIPLWSEAKYIIQCDGKEIVLRTLMPEGTAGESGSGGLLQGAQVLISAPWDASSAGRRRKPQPGTEVIDRIACGSFEARDDLHEHLNDLIATIGDGREDSFRLASLRRKRSSGTELATVDAWEHENETELQSTSQKRMSQGEVDRLMWTSNVRARSNSGKQNRERSPAKQRTPASLEKTVRRLSMSGTRRAIDSKRLLRVIIASKLSSCLVLRLLDSKIEQGVWRAEAPKLIAPLDAKMLEIDFDGSTEDTRAGELNGSVAYEVIDTAHATEDDSGQEQVGQIVLEFFNGKDTGTSFTTRASQGFQADFVRGSGSHGTVVFTVRETEEVGGTSSAACGSVGVKANVDGRRSAPRGSGSGGNRGRSAGGSSGGSSGLSEDEKLLQQLVEIGFKFEDAVSALAEAGGDMVKAVDILTR